MNLKQAENESMYSFLYRVMNLYFRSRDKETPTIEEIAKDQVSKTDIVHIFLEGLLSNEVKTNLRMRLSTIEFKDLTKVAREIEQALPARTPINFTQTINNSELSLKIDQLEKSLESMVLQINERFSRSQTPGRNVRFGRSKSRGRQGFRGKSRNYRSLSRDNGYTNNYRHDRSKSRGRYNTKKSWRDLKKANFKCFNCGKYGHTQKWCRQLQNRSTK